MNCSFCGFQFSIVEGEQACRGCILHKNCGLVRCPQCGYETLPESRLASWIRAKLSGLRGEVPPSMVIPPGGITSLADLQEGQSGRVVRFHRTNGAARHFMKLVAMGLYPGAPITLMRRSPSFVFRTGYSEFAIDAELASLVDLQVDRGKERP